MRMIKECCRKSLFFLRVESKRKYEFGLLLGTFFTLLGILLFHFFNIGLIFFWTIAVIAKALVILSIMGYIRYRKVVEGFDDDQWYGDLKKIVKKTGFWVKNNSSFCIQK